MRDKNIVLSDCPFCRSPDLVISTMSHGERDWVAGIECGGCLLVVGDSEMHETEQVAMDSISAKWNARA